MSLFNYAPEQDTAGERFMLIAMTGKGSDFGHINVEFVREAVPHRKNPDTMATIYGDGENVQGYRRTSWSSNKKTAFLIENLQIVSQMSRDRGFEDGQPYGVDIEYRNVFSVDRGEAIKMADTLKRIDAKLTKLDQEFGYGSGDLSTFILRIASIMGIKKFLIRRTDDNGSSSLSDAYNYRTVAPTQVKYEVEQMMKEFYGVTA